MEIRLIPEAARCGSRLKPRNVNDHPWSWSLGKDAFSDYVPNFLFEKNTLSFVQTFIQFSESTVQVDIV